MVRALASGGTLASGLPPHTRAAAGNVPLY
jgi:hypothetical protein